jgi:hypothetical protein
MAPPAVTPGSVRALLSSYTDHCHAHGINDSFQHVDRKLLLERVPLPLILKVRSVKWQGTHGRIRLFRIVLFDGETELLAHPSFLSAHRSKLHHQIQHGGDVSISAGKLVRIDSFDMCQLRDPGSTSFSSSLILKGVSRLPLLIGMSHTDSISPSLCSGMCGIHDFVWCNSRVSSKSMCAACLKEPSVHTMPGASK